MRLLLLALLLVTLGCQDVRQDVLLHRGEGALAEPLRVSLTSSPDRLGLGVAWAITVTNVGEARVDDLVLVLDEAWSVPIRRLRIDPSVCATWDEDPASLPPGKSLVVRSSHDITNHYLLRNEADEPYPADRVPRSVGLESAGSRAVWRAR